MHAVASLVRAGEHLFLDEHSQQRHIKKGKHAGYNIYLLIGMFKLH